MAQALAQGGGQKQGEAARTSVRPTSSFAIVPTNSSTCQHGPPCHGHQWGKQCEGHDEQPFPTERAAPTIAQRESHTTPTHNAPRTHNKVASGPHYHRSMQLSSREALAHAQGALHPRGQADRLPPIAHTYIQQAILVCVKQLVCFLQGPSPLKQSSRNELHHLPLPVFGPAKHDAVPVKKCAVGHPAI